MLPTHIATYTDCHPTACSNVLASTLHQPLPPYTSCFHASYLQLSFIAATYNCFRAFYLYIPHVHAYYIYRLHHMLTVLSLAKCTVDYNYLPPRSTLDNISASL